jgi:hypothetical protein
MTINNKRCHSCLVPIFSARIKGHKPHVSSRSRHFKKKVLMLIRFFYRIALLRKKRIIQGIYKKSRDAYFQKVWFRTAFSPVFLSVGKSMKRGSITLIVFFECLDRSSLLISPLHPLKFKSRVYWISGIFLNSIG